MKLYQLLTVFIITIMLVSSADIKPSLAATVNTSEVISKNRENLLLEKAEAVKTSIAKESKASAMSCLDFDFKLPGWSLPSLGDLLAGLCDAANGAIDAGNGFVDDNLSSYSQGTMGLSDNSVEVSPERAIPDTDRLGDMSYELLGGE